MFKQVTAVLVSYGISISDIIVLVSYGLKTITSIVDLINFCVEKKGLLFIVGV